MFDLPIGLSKTTDFLLLWEHYAHMVYTITDTPYRNNFLCFKVHSETWVKPMVFTTLKNTSYISGKTGREQAQWDC